MAAQAAMPLTVSAPVPMPTGSIEAYIQTVNRFPLLSLEEEQRLARQFRNANDLDCRTCGWWWRSPAATSATACRTPT